MISRFSPAAIVERMRERYHPVHAMRRVPALRRLAQLCDRQVWARIHGVSHPVRLYVLRNGSYLLNRRSPEPRIAALVLAVLDAYDIKSFWDVGANIGYYSWLISSAQPAVRVLAVEPDPVNFAVLVQTRRHAPPGVEVLNVAVSEQDGTATFLVDNVSGATGTLELSSGTFNERHYGEARRSTTVPTRSLDSLSAERGAPDLLKIDVEGHESAVLEGAALLLASGPIILIEAFDAGAPALHTLRSAGFVLLSAASLAVTIPDDGNYVAIPRRHLQRLEALRLAHARRLAAIGFAPRL